MPSTRLKMPQPARTRPKWKDQLGANRPVAPRLDGCDRARQEQEPRGYVEEAVSQRVHFEARHGVGRVALDVTHHVVPLEDLVQHDAVDEAAEPKAVEQSGCLRRHLWSGCLCSRVHVEPVPNRPFRQTRSSA